MKDAGGIGRANVQEQAVSSAACTSRAPCCLEHVAGDLVDRRVAVCPKRRIKDSGARRYLVPSRVGVGQPVGALVPLSTPVRSRPDQVVELEIDQWRLATGRPIG